MRTRETGTKGTGVSSCELADIVVGGIGNSSVDQDSSCELRAREKLRKLFAQLVVEGLSRPPSPSCSATNVHGAVDELVRGGIKEREDF